MPILTTDRQKIEITLPKTKGKVWVWEYLLAGESLEIERIFSATASPKFDPATEKIGEVNLDINEYYTSQDRLLEIMVTDWDFTDTDGNKLPHTLDNIKNLPSDDYRYLIGKVNNLATDRLLSADKKKEY